MCNIIRVLIGMNELDLKESKIFLNSKDINKVISKMATLRVAYCYRWEKNVYL